MQKETREFRIACEKLLDVFVPACGGHEKVFTKNGARYLYVFNPSKMQHKYLNVDTDVLLSDDEVANLIWR